MKLLQRILFGERAPGEKLGPPTVTTTYPDEMPADFNDWINSTLGHLKDKRRVANKKKVARSIKKA